MKKYKLIVSGAIVVLSVTTGLAFKPFGLGNIFCFWDGVVPLVISTKACDHPDQPPSARVDWSLSNNPAHPTTSPCGLTSKPFYSTPTSCTQKTPGTDHFISSLP